MSQALSHLSLEGILKFFSTAVQINLIKFPLFEIVRPARALVS